MTAFPKGHPGVEFTLFVSLFTEVCVIVFLSLFYIDSVLFRPAYLGLVLLSILLALFFRFVLRVNRYLPYIVLCGSISWIGLTLSGIYAGVALVPIVLILPIKRIRPLAIFHVLKQWISGQLRQRDENDQPRNVKRSFFFENRKTKKSPF